MATILDAYEHYQIMPFLQLHQVRVAAVTKMICAHLSLPITTADVIEACLLHDMGNILKFDLSKFPDSVKPEGRDYWENIKRETAERYRTHDEHEATLLIARELGVSAEVLEYIDAIGFSNAKEVQENNNYEKKICCYADMRVAPTGVLSLAGRIKDGRDRYTGRKGYHGFEDWFDEIGQAYRRVESDIFRHTDFTAEDITDEAIEPLLVALRQTPLRKP